MESESTERCIISVETSGVQQTAFIDLLAVLIVSIDGKKTTDRPSASNINITYIEIWWVSVILLLEGEKVFHSGNPVVFCDTRICPISPAVCKVTSDERTFPPHITSSG